MPVLCRALSVCHYNYCIVIEEMQTSPKHSKPQHTDIETDGSYNCDEFDLMKYPRTSNLNKNDLKNYPHKSPIDKNCYDKKSVADNSQIKNNTDRTDNEALREEVRKLRKENSELKETVRLLEETATLAIEDKETVLNKLGHTEAELELVRTMLRRYQAVEMEEMSFTRSRALDRHRDRYEERWGHTRVGEDEGPSVMVSSEGGYDEIDSGVGLITPPTPLFSIQLGLDEKSKSHLQQIHESGPDEGLDDIDGQIFDMVDRPSSHFDELDGSRSHFDEVAGSRPHFDEIDGSRSHFDEVDGSRSHFDEIDGSRSHFDEVDGSRSHFDKVDESRTHFDEIDGSRSHFDEVDGSRSYRNSRSRTEMKGPERFDVVDITPSVNHMTSTQCAENDYDDM